MLDEAVHHHDLPTTVQGATVASAPIGATASFQDPLLQSYNAWLIYERRALIEEMHGPEIAAMPDPFEIGYFQPNNAGARFHYQAFKDPKAPRPSSRAATVLDAVGCDWINRKRRPVPAAQPDPVFALIAAERVAWDAYDQSIDRLAAAESAFIDAGLNRKPRVMVGETTTIVSGPDMVPLPQSDWKAEPIYAYSVEDIERSYGKAPAEPIVLLVGDKKTRIETTVHDARESALARFEADRKSLEEAPEAIAYREAEARNQEALDRHEKALNAIFVPTPATSAGLIALLDLFDEREMHNVGEPFADLLTSLFCCARAYLDGVNFTGDDTPAGWTRSADRQRDPVLALLAREDELFREAEVAMIRDENGSGDVEAKRHREFEAVLMSTAPTTVAGFAAVLERWIERHGSVSEADGMPFDLIKSLIKAGGGSAETTVPQQPAPTLQAAE